MHNKAFNIQDVSAKQWLCLTTSDKEFENIGEMTRDIWPYFDGICAVVHTQGGDNRIFDLLETRKGQGFVIKRPYSWHHGHAKNEWLFDKRIEPLANCIVLDSLERLNLDFVKNLRKFSDYLFENNVWNVARYSKLFMFRRWYGQQFFHGLHWGCHGLYDETIALEQIPEFKDDKNCIYSMRNEKRPFDHRFRHEIHYLLDYGLNGNHLQLFHNDPKELDTAQWELYHFTEYLKKNEVRTADEWIEFFQKEENKRLDTQTKWWINAERPFRNAYRYFVLKHTNEEILKDEDTWRLL